MAIQINAILEQNGAYSPKSTPLNYGNYFDGEYFYFFESKEECEEWQKQHNVNLIIK